ncbi:unnamed protein product [Parascedosporium putredinis]|uniref:Uncharacterized protein n=1 Tax=Parascedosporium putredinis TaxID=1442378 RepID=A0A9P1MEU2_9PEZI|nr:unnamed protein product [Parascedosporium putredinis]CAI8001151.1 unnamed protein product [Parascedosporium putredinis]
MRRGSLVFRIVLGRALEDSRSIAEADADSSIDSTPDRNPTSTAYIRALQETCVNIVPSHKGTQSPEHQTPLFDASPTSLTIQFGRLRIASLETPKDPSERGQASESPSPVLSKRLPLRPALAVETFDPRPSPGLLGPIEFLAPITEEAVSDLVVETRDSGASFQDHPLMQLPACLPSVEDQVAKLQAGQYEYSIAYPQTVQASLDIIPDENEEPAHAKDKTRIVYGCNPARRNAVLSIET